MSDSQPRIFNNEAEFDQSASQYLRSFGISDQSVVSGLGYFSLAIGAAEVLMTRSLARIAGLDERYSLLLRVFGFREISSGIGILTGNKNQKAWVWSRVVGDALDGAFLAYAFFTEKSVERRKRIAISAAAVAPIIALDVYEAARFNGAWSRLGSDADSSSSAA